MDLWSRARVFAEETAKRSQELSLEAAKRSQEFVSETAKKSRDLAVEATAKTADLIKTEALRRADQIKTLAAEIPSSIPQIPHPELPSFPVPASPPPPPPAELERFGITEDLREFARGLTISTFRDFPVHDEPPMSEVPTVSNVRQDLNEWQARHATLVLSEVKEISKFRYELCPRYMKERKFWRIYFILVNSFVAPYERKYTEELNQKSREQKQNDAKENPTSAPALQAESKETKLQSKTSTSTTREQDLDVFLLGDLGSSDEGPDDGDDAFDDDFDKIENTSGLDSEDDQKTVQK